MSAWSMWSVIGIVYISDALFIALRLIWPPEVPSDWFDVGFWMIFGLICLVIGVKREKQALAAERK